MISSGLSSLGVVSDDSMPTDTLYKEGKRIIDLAESKVKVILEENKERLFELAACLSLQESIGRPALEKILYQ
jgi:vesicle-fusing ATPase